MILSRLENTGHTIRKAQRDDDRGIAVVVKLYYERNGVILFHDVRSLAQSSLSKVGLIACRLVWWHLTSIPLSRYRVSFTTDTTTAVVLSYFFFFRR